MSLPLPLARTATADPIRVQGFPPAAADPPSIASCFGAFLRRVVPTQPVYAAAREACADVVTALRTGLYPKGIPEHAGSDHLIAGSVGKRTAIAPIQVVDMLYLLPTKLAAARVDDALKIAWAVLKSRFDGAAVAADHSGVLVQRGPLWVKILPSLKRDGVFLIPGRSTPERTSGWCFTNPLAEAATLRLSDSLYGGRPRLLLAALKAWQANGAVPTSSFVLELLAQEFYASLPRPYELDRALIDFWAWARKRPLSPLRPPGGQTVVELDTAWHGKAKAAYWRATLVDHHVKDGKIIDAALEWRHVLGPAFPVPGEMPPRTLPLFRKDLKPQRTEP